MFKIIKSSYSLTGQFVTKELSFKDFTFPAGEVSVKLNANDYGYKSFGENKPFSHQTIIARIHDSADVMKLAMFKDALERFDNTPIQLFIPYFPYGRQDRIVDKGESFSLGVFAKIINSLGFQKVTIADPHSLVTEALIDRVQVISQCEIVNKWLEFTDVCMHSVLLSPDAGSNKKTAEVAGYLNHFDFIRADKLRDLTNGKIKETIIYKDDLQKQDVVILDDICERGGTFLALANALKAKNCGKIILYVTHGIFGGEKEQTEVRMKLRAGGIDEIYTTNSYHDNLLEDGNLHVLNLEDKFRDII